MEGPRVETEVVLKLSSTQVPDRVLDMKAYVVDHVAGQTPSMPIQKARDFLKGLTLADPNYHRPGKIDLLLGQDILADVLIYGEPRRGKHGSPVAIETIFGWTIGGRVGKLYLPQTDDITPTATVHVATAVGRRERTDPDLLAIRRATTFAGCAHARRNRSIRSFHSKHTRSKTAEDSRSSCRGRRTHQRLEHHDHRLSTDI